MPATEKNRIALIGIIVDDSNVIERLNATLHEYSNLIIGRMGIPYRPKGIAVISIVLDATENDINALSGKLGKINGINVKTLYTKKES